MIVTAHVLGQGDITTNGEVYCLNFVVEDRSGRISEEPVYFYEKVDAQAVQAYYRTAQSFNEPLEFEV